MMKKIISKLLIVAFCISSSAIFYSCSEDDLGASLIVDEELEPGSATYEFELWLKESFEDPYNLNFIYRMVDGAADPQYNLVPARLEKSEEMAKLIKYLWFDPYAVVAPNGDNFLKMNGPRIIHLIGSPAINPVSQSEILGTAEGGIKVTLYKCNELDRTNVTLMNEFYFNTMHHEFAHILHQKKNYPTDFQNISKGKYRPTDWSTMADDEAPVAGFISTYAASSPDEDFVETISNYITKTDDEWNAILDKGIDTSVEVDGRTTIERKLEICTKWLDEAWGIDLDTLRNEVQTRQLHIEDIFN